MPRHTRASFSSQTSTTSSTTTTSVLVSTQAPSLNTQNSGYGLLEPTSSSPTSSPTRQHTHLYGEPPRRVAPSIQARRHHRKSSSLASVGLPSVNVPAWSEVEAGIDSLRDKSLEFGAGIGELGGQLVGRVPAVRGGVAFLSTLRSNLQLSTALAPPSPYLHPVSPLPPRPIPTAYPTTITMPSPSAESAPEADPLDNIPLLTYGPPSSTEDRHTAIKLVADSVAQKRQTVASGLIKSRVFLALLVALFSAAYQLLPKSKDREFRLLLTSVGLIMTALISVRYLVAGYLSQAEGITEAWIGADEVLAAKFGDAVVGAAIWRVESAGRKKIGVIRGFSTRRRERGRGVGKGLLEALVERAIREKGCSEVRFAERGEGRAGEEKALPALVEKITGVESALQKREDEFESVLDACFEVVRGGNGKALKGRRRS